MGEGETFLVLGTIGMVFSILYAAIARENPKDSLSILFAAISTILSIILLAFGLWFTRAAEPFDGFWVRVVRIGTHLTCFLGLHMTHLVYCTARGQNPYNLPVFMMVPLRTLFSRTSGRDEQPRSLLDDTVWFFSILNLTFVLLLLTPLLSPNLLMTKVFLGEQLLLTEKVILFVTYSLITLTALFALVLCVASLRQLKQSAEFIPLTVVLMLGPLIFLLDGLYRYDVLSFHIPLETFPIALILAGGAFVPMRFVTRRRALEQRLTQLTTQRETLADVMESEARLGLLLENVVHAADVGVLVTGPRDEVVIICNSLLERRLGWTNLLGRPIPEGLNNPPKGYYFDFDSGLIRRSADWEDSLLVRMAKTTAATVRLKLTDIDGKETLWQVSSKSLQAESARTPSPRGPASATDRGETGDFSWPSVKRSVRDSAGSVFCLREVSERVALLKVLMRSEEYIAQARLAAGIAHEVNNPLTAVSSIVQFLLEEDLDPDTRTHIRNARDTIEGLSRTLHDYLGMYRTSTDATNYIDVGALFERTVELLRNHPHLAQTTIRTQVESDLGAILGNEQMLQHAFLGLLLFFAEMTQPGTEIDVRLGRADSSILLELGSAGIDLSEAQELLRTQVFVRESPSRGAGALQVSKHIFRRIGGSLSIESDDNRLPIMVATIPAT